MLADDPLPGYTGRLRRPSRDADRTADRRLRLPGLGHASRAPSSGAPGTFEEVQFTIGPNDANGGLTIRIEWAQAVNDFDMFLEKVESNGDRTVIGQSTQTQGESDFEQIVVENRPRRAST